VLREMLSMSGAELVCVENGRQLVERLLQDGVSSYDIVVTDVQMPEMDGYEATRRIRELAPDMPVVGLTAHALAEERERCLASGMSAHVGKPVDMGTLASTILTLVRRRAMPAAQPSMIGTKIQPPCPDVPVDWAALEAVFPGRAEFIDRLCRLLLDGHGETPARLRELAGRKESEELARLSHNLKGMTGNLMAVSVSRLANEVQQAAKAGAQDMGKLANELADAMERLLAAVTQRLARNGTDPG
jgi:CheY-like chemotaxis protein